MAQTTKLTHKNVKEMVKHDAFRERTMETVEYVSGHRGQIIKYAAAAIVILAIGFGTWIYREGQHAKRESALAEALKIYDSQVVKEGNPPPFAIYWYRSEAEKLAAVNKSFNGIVDQYGGSDEAMIAHYYLALIAGDGGNPAEAEKQLRIVVDNATSDYASLAKLSLAELDKSNGKQDEAIKLVQSVLDKPTTFVSKEEATIEMARLLQHSKPDEAKKLLEPLRTSLHSSVSQAAISLLGEIMQQK